MRRLLAVFGIEARLRRLRIAAGEGALAAEDRAQLLRMAWAEERIRIRWVLMLTIAVVVLTTVVAGLLSVAVVVHFWDSPHRAFAAWMVAGLWTILWLLALVGLLRMLHATSPSAAAAREEFGLDWRWVQSRIGARERGPGHRERRPATREDLLARMARQRERIAQLETPAPATPRSAAPRASEPLSASALRIAREHPVATAAAVSGVVVVLGPRRVVRLVTWLAPIVWKMRK